LSQISVCFAILAGIGAVYYAVSAYALHRHFRAQPRETPFDHTPRVSVLKPVCGVDTEAEANFRSYVEQDYPDFEVLFGALDKDDPAAEIAAGVAATSERARFHVGASIAGSNNKVRILHELALRAVGEVIVVTDADTRADPDFLRRLVAPFADAEVGAVTCLYRGIHAHTVADKLEGLHMTTCFAPGVAMSEMIGPVDFALGAAVALKREALSRIGGFEAVVDYLADDFQIGNRVARLGFRVIVSDCVVDLTLSGESLADVLRREVRWVRTTRASRPAGYVGLVFSFGFAYALMGLLASRFSAAGWALFGVVSTIRLVGAWVGAVRMGDSEFASRVHLMPLRDVASFLVWIGGFLSKNVVWRGRKLRVETGGKCVPIAK